ncbi:MAG: LytTR family DNA-binding domain-containing protein [Gemmatimonadota bacterium]
MSDHRQLRTVIVDDEPHARAKLRRFIEADGRMALVGEAGDGVEAVDVLESTRPDLVFLDIQMPEMDGFGVLAELDPAVNPQVVFVTAHDQHALKAFEVRALDYLLKPVDQERFAEAVHRAIEAHGAGAEPDTRSVLSELPAERRALERFLVRSRSRMMLVPASRVDWIGSASNYVELHCGTDTHLVRGTLQDLEERLDPSRFARIHRSTIVNLEQVKELHPWSHGDLMLVLRDGTELRLSRRYKDRLGSVFGP